MTWGQARILSTEGGSSRSHYVEESFWKRLWTCSLTDYWWWWWWWYEDEVLWGDLKTRPVSSLLQTARWKSAEIFFSSHTTPPPFREILRNVEEDRNPLLLGPLERTWPPETSAPTYIPSVMTSYLHQHRCASLKSNFTTENRFNEARSLRKHWKFTHEFVTPAQFSLTVNKLTPQVVVTRVRKIVKSDYQLPSRLSVRPSVRPSAWNNSAPTRRIFVKFQIWVSVEYLSTKLKFH